MRLFQVIAGSEFGGFERFCVSLSFELAQGTGIAQKIATRPWPERLERFAECGISTVSLKFGGPLDVVGKIKLGREIAHYHPDVVLTWANRATSMTPRGAAPVCGRIGHYYNLKYYARTDCLITITQALRDYVIAGGYPADRVAAIPNFHRAKTAQPLDRSGLGTPKDVPLVAAVGRLHKAKGFDVLLRALAGQGDVHLWLAGTGPEEAALKALSAELGLDDRVRFLGWRDDAEALMTTADVVAMPSRSEGLGTVIFEAWASGTPLVAAASEGPGEFVRDGENGRLVAIDDVEALGQAISGLLSDPGGARQLAATANAEYRANYTAEKIAGRYAETLGGFARLGPRQGPRRLTLKSPDTKAADLRARMAP